MWMAQVSACAVGVVVVCALLHSGWVLHHSYMGKEELHGLHPQMPY